MTADAPVSRIRETVRAGRDDMRQTLLDWLPFFPVTRDQLTMLADGNTAEPDEVAALIKREPAEFSPENLGYLAG